MEVPPAPSGKKDIFPSFWKHGCHILPTKKQMCLPAYYWVYEICESLHYVFIYTLQSISTFLKDHMDYSLGLHIFPCVSNLCQ